MNPSSYLLLFAVKVICGFQVYDIPLNATAGYEEITFRQKLDNWEAYPYFPFHTASPEQLIDSKLTNGTLPNGLIEAVYLACTNHHGLKLSPDTIFFSFLQALALKIKISPQLAKSLVKADLMSTIDFWLGGFKDVGEWEEILIGLQQYEKENVNPILYSALKAQFSTSTKLTSAMFLLILQARENAAHLKRNWTSTNQAECEIPAIELEGRPEDWQRIRLRAESLLTLLDMNNWKWNLLPVLDEFVAASEGFPDVAFWNQIYKRNNANHILVSGWINVFFPVIRQNWALDVNKCTSDNFTKCDGVPIGAFPALQTNYMFVIRHWLKYYLVTVAVEVSGTQKDADGNFIKPVVGWAVFLSEPYQRKWSWSWY